MKVVSIVKFNKGLFGLTTKQPFVMLFPFQILECMVQEKDC
jgi:hypothetical protein